MLAIKTRVLLCRVSFSMLFILESVWEWVVAHLVSKCVQLPVPDECGLGIDPEGVYECLFADGVRNWGRKAAYVTWLKNTFGPIKGFMTLCKINQKRLR